MPKVFRLQEVIIRGTKKLFILLLITFSKTFLWPIIIIITSHFYPIFICAVQDNLLLCGFSPMHNPKVKDPSNLDRQTVSPPLDTILRPFRASLIFIIIFPKININFFKTWRLPRHFLTKILYAFFIPPTKQS